MKTGQTIVPRKTVYTNASVEAVDPYATVAEGCDIADVTGEVSRTRPSSYKIFQRTLNVGQFLIITTTGIC